MVRIILAILAALVSAIHFFAGGTEVAAPLLKLQEPNTFKIVLYACWHIVTFFLLWSAFIFWKGGNAAFHFGILWTGSALSFLWACYFVPEEVDFFSAPQWILLAPIGLLAMWSNRQSIL